jgi:NAD(P)-dependent dehydrogenase (short-subunit alcohol dehydrogenase family)
MTTALITGASRGIGAAIAEELGARGMSVVLCARGRDGLVRRAADLRARGVRCDFLELDVADPGAAAALPDRVREIECHFGPLTALVNNAGIAVSAPLERSATHPDGDLFERHLEVNFHGARRLVEALVPAMLERGAGRVLNVASSAGLQGYAYVSAYCASKHALVGYTRAAALELGPKGVAFGALCPHYVDSPMLAASIANVVEKTGRSEAEARAFFAAQNPDGRLVEPEAVARVAADWIEGGENGAVLELTGREVHRRS